MKTFKTLLVVTGLLCSVQAMACSVYINVKNETGTTIDSASVAGPWGRYSDTHELKNGESFSYHATGSMFTCHCASAIEAQSGDPHCDMGAHGVTMNSDGTAYYTILKEKNSDNSCKVTITH